LALLLLSPLGSGGLGGESASAAPASLTVSIVAKDAKTGDTIPHFKWMINVDNSHDEATPGMDGPSLEAPATFSPVVASGDETNASGIVVDGAGPDDRGYLVSVLANDGVGGLNDPEYKIGGAHFNSNGSVVVELQPNPLPLATVRVRVFHDNQLVNAEDDIPLEEGLAGFHVTLADRVGEVTTNWYGDPICTQYDAGGNPIPGTGGFCVTDSDGYATIPDLGPDKYEVEAIPPDGSNWIQTTTIEGTLHIDAWVEEGHDGFSTEEGFTQAVVWFGFVKPCSFGDTGDTCPSNNDAGSATINGRVMSITLDDESGIIQLGNPVKRPYVALNNIGGNDEQVYTGRGNADGTFTIPNVPLGLYQLVMWDGPLDHIINFRTVRVDEQGETVELGDIGIPRWFGTIRGYAYIDNGVAADGTPIPGGDENGQRDCYDDGDGIQFDDLDSCERGLPNQDLDTRFKDGTIQYATFSDSKGYYEFPEVFELEHFAIAEVGYGRLKQTGAAGYATDELGNPLNYPGDCNFPTDAPPPPDGPVNCDEGLASLLQAEVTWAGTTNYIDWGKKAHDPGENGGIVGIVFNATTRNELDARLQAAEDYEPGVPGAVVNLYAPVLDENGEPVYAADGSVMKDHIVATYGGADDWYASLPTDCVPQGSIGRAPGEIEPNGVPASEPSLFEDCIELPALLPQIKSGVFDGGYAFEEDCTDPLNPSMDPEDLLEEGCVPLDDGKWIVEVVPPAGYRPVMEEDINVFGGDQLVPAVPPPPCAGPMHTVDVVDDPSDAHFDPTDPSNTQGVYNPDFLATPSPLAPSGGSPYEGQEKPLCNARLVELPNESFVNSDFFIFTDAVGWEGPEGDEIATGAGVPAPGRIRGVLLDDLVTELDPESPMYAEKRGIPHAPVGIRDFTGKLITTVYSDENGYWEVLLPSTGTYNCALPAGPCPGVYQVIGNDPGTPQSPNEGWNPNYGSLKLSFDVWPGLTTYADVAILPITGFVQDPGSQFESPPICEVPAATPDIHFVDEPFGAAGSTVDITGSGFTGATATLDGTAIPTVVNSDTSISATIPADTTPGPHQLLVKDGGLVSPAGMTFHVIGGAYTPLQIHVDPSGSDATGTGTPGNPYMTIQKALDVATAGNLDGSLVLVHPGVYFESLLMTERVKLQGYGPGPGPGASVIDGRFFNFGGISATDFAAKIAGVAYDGPTTVPMGQVVTVVAENGEFTDSFNAQIDGFAIRGGTRVRGNRTIPAMGGSQGGAVYGHAYTRHLEVSNNVLQSNAGNLGGGVILGRPNTANPDAGGAMDSENDFVRIHHNRLLNNGGISLAGAIGLFNGTQAYEIDHNEICGNYSAEYGGGISNYGYSSGSIHDNEILFNYAFDEGGGIMLAGEQPANVSQVSPGTGDISVERNQIQGNVSNDDGGGVRLLQPVDGRIQIVNNMIVNNLATDSGGGISLDDALRVEIVNNTIARNISTSTAEDAPIDDDAVPPPPVPGPGRITVAQGAGIVSELHSQALLDAESLPAGSFSDPVLFNNIIWQNRACYLDGLLTLFGTDGCESPGLPSAGYIDLEVLGGGSFTKVKNNLCTADLGDPGHCPAGGGNISGAPDFAAPGAVETSFSALAFGGDPTFVTVILRFPPEDVNYPGNYHIAAGSPAVNAGSASEFSVLAPCDDFEGDGRPNGSTWDIGADERPGGASKCLYFSTEGNVSVPGVTGAAPPPGGFDDADIYKWNSAAFARVFDARDSGVVANGADVDALVAVDDDTFYMSFLGDGTSINPPGPPPAFSVQNEDIVKYDAGTWTIFFDGSDVGLGADENIDAFEILGAGNVLISVGADNQAVAGIADYDNEDLIRCTGTFVPGTTDATAVTSCSSWSFFFDGSDVAVGDGTPAGQAENIDGAAVVGGDVYLSTTGAFTVTGPLSGADEDVFVCTGGLRGAATTCTSFSLFFDGSANVITDDLDAIDRR
jgi:hypothetical protein